jgi:hypothetical protein
MAVARNAVVRTPRRPRRKAGPVQVRRVHDAVWRAAQFAAQGNPALIRIVSPTTVRVLDGRYSPPR